MISPLVSQWSWPWSANLIILIFLKIRNILYMNFADFSIRYSSFKSINIQNTLGFIQARFLHSLRFYFHQIKNWWLRETAWGKTQRSREKTNVILLWSCLCLVKCDWNILMLTSVKVHQFGGYQSKSLRITFLFIFSFILSFLSEMFFIRYFFEFCNCIYFRK